MQLNAQPEGMLMLDRETEVRIPHSRADGRVSVAMQADGVTLTLFFERATALTGKAPLLEIRLEPAADGRFEPAKLVPHLPLHLAYARASLAREKGDVRAAIAALRETNKPRRGLTDEFLKAVAMAYESLVAEGELAPITALAKLQPADKSTASRWVSAARARGFLTTEDEG
jgi:hypothetical protein